MGKISSPIYPQQPDLLQTLNNQVYYVPLLKMVCYKTYTLGVQSHCQMMSKGCIITSETEGIYRFHETILRRWLDP